MTRQGPSTDTAELHVGDTLQTTIEKAVYRGRGLGRLGGRLLDLQIHEPSLEDVCFGLREVAA